MVERIAPANNLLEEVQNQDLQDQFNDMLYATGE